MKDYYSTHMVLYEPPEQIGFDSLPILPFLLGRKWDQIALAYVHSVYPTSIRVTTGECKTDSRHKRVTVFVDDDDTIRWIEQEVEIGWIPLEHRIHPEFMW